MVKRIVALLAAWALALGLCACAAAQPEASDAPDAPAAEESQSPTWRDYYDLGVRYLSEGNYREAILAFTAAIDINPRRAPAYVGRGDAHVLSGETQSNLAAAEADYQRAIELDETIAEAYLGLADVYIRQGEYETAYDILQEGLEKTSNDRRILDKIAEIESGVYSDSQNNVRRRDTYTTDGKWVSYTIYEYDFLGRRCRWSNYSRGPQNSDSFELNSYCEVDFDDDSRPSRNRFYDSDGMETSHDTFEYNEKGLKAVQRRYNADDILEYYFLYYYDDEGKQTKYEGYNSSETMFSYWISEYDEQGNRIREVRYSPDGEQKEYTLFN